jgi:hypothetical protein
MMPYIFQQTRGALAWTPLPPICLKALRDHAERQAVERVNAGMDWENLGLVFPSRLGTPMEPDNLRQSWGRMVNRPG